MGKGGTQIYQPTPPPQPSTSDAITAWANTMPQVYETQMKYAPLQAAQQVQLAQQYAPQLGAAAKAGQEALYPETTALQEKLAGQASAGMDAGMPDWMKEQYRSNYAANLGTNVGSGIGADYISTGMLQAQQNYQNYYRNLGLSLAGRQPLSQPTMPQTGRYSQQFQPQNAMNMMTQTYAPYAAASRPMQMQNRPLSLGFLGQWG